MKIDEPSRLLEEHLAYWQQRLADCPLLLPLPTDYARPPVQSLRSAIYRQPLSANVVQELTALGQQEDSTLFMALVATFSALLMRYTGQTDIVIGWPMVEQDRADRGDQSDRFVNNLVLRISLSGKPTFREVLRHVREVTMGAYQHQDLPFQRLIDLLDVPYDQSYQPFLQVALAMAAQPLDRLDLAGVHGNDLELPPGVSRSDLLLTLEERPEGLTAAWYYATDLFAAATISRMATHFAQLLRSILANPDCAVSDVPMLTDNERQQLLVDWNQTHADYPSDCCMHHMFEQQVARTPDAVAVVCAQQQITYRDLNARANQLAHHLRRLGVGPDMLVGLCLERSPDMMVGVLGILKAGGAYVPLDPSYPAQRLAFMLADTQASVLLTQQAIDHTRWIIDDKPGSTPGNVSIVYIDQDWPAIAQEAATNPDVTMGADNLAYVIYTSGSTGQPKGVQIVHRAVVNLMVSMWHQPGINASDALLAITTISFDMAGVDLFLPLSVGARMIMVSQTVASDGVRLRQILETMPVTFMQATPTTWRMLLLAGWVGSSRLKALCGGEALPPDLAAQLVGRVGQLWNMYGPTETTIWSALERVYPAMGPITVGRPIANTQFYILDPQRQPVPIGVVGEIYIGGVGMARGYLNRPELTAERFVPNPSGDGRLYQTGDLGRYLPDGRIEVPGRRDHQVKVRGFRIELGEIEAVLSQHPAVQQAAVLACDDGLEKRLVAYVVANGTNPAMLRAHLAEHLPDYMIPAAFVTLDALPLTSSGKIDRTALPAPDATSLVRAAYTAPATTTEQTLVAIWQEVFGLDQVGIHDDFFALGGHSLLAIRLGHSIQQQLGQALPMVALFEHPTIASLATFLDEVGSLDDQIARIPIALFDHQPTVFPLTHGQQALWFIQQSAPLSSAYNSGVAVQLSGPLNAQALRQALHALVSRHPLLRTTITIENHQPVQVVHGADHVALELVDGSGWNAIERAQQVAMLFAHPFDLTQGVCRATLITGSEDDHLLLLAVHHVATDAGSNDVLVQDLAALYTAAISGSPASLPPLRYSYADYVRWEAEMLRVEGQRLRSYWHTQLAGELPVLALPTDYPRPPVQRFSGAVYTTILDAALTEQIKNLARTRRVTLFTLLLASYQVLLYRLSGQTDILVGSAPEAGRSRPEFSSVVGYFVNPIVLRATFDAAAPPTFAAFLDQMQQTVQAALSHQHYPFPLLVQELLPQRDASIPPLIQTLFLLYQRQSWPANDSYAGKIAPYRFDATDGQGAGQLDLSLLIADQGDTLEVVFDYTPDLFAASTIARLAGHFETLLRTIVATPDQGIDTLALLTDAERQQLLVTWNNTAAEYPRDRCMHDLVAEQAERTPAAVAVVFEQQQLTYGELNARANQVAHYLRNLGVGPEVLVGLCMERSLDMLVGILGILKAGGAYVPLDPNYPAERLAFMLADAQVTVLLTQQRLDDGRWAMNPGLASIVSIDADWPRIAHEPATNPDGTVRPANLAYVIYTSGSTGTPNGVQVTHRSLVNYICSFARRCNITAADRILQFASISFDASLEEIFPCLIRGATLVLRSKDMMASFQALHDFIDQHGLTMLDLPTAYWHAWVEQLSLEPVALPRSLRLVIIGGEAALAEHYAAWRRLVAGHICLLNSYGPTETTIVATIATLDQENAPMNYQLAGTLPIGRPIDNVQVYVLDARQQVLPIGMPGELYIGGEGLARGYLGRPELTARRFIPHPFQPEADTRLYRTGDLVRYRDNGTLEFLGRTDQQVKIRGFRVELGEIEAVLSQHPDVEQAVVVAREDAVDKRLIAYVVGEDVTDPASLRLYLAERLPDYMLPAAFVLLDALPLTPGGKIDRNALPAPHADSLAYDAYVAPNTATEQILVAIWQNVLDLDRVGTHDNFFALGGHSLLAVRLGHAIQHELGQALPMAALFQHPTVAGLAALLDGADRVDDQIARIPIPLIDQQPTVFSLAYGQQALWFIQQSAPLSSAYNSGVAVRMPDPMDVQALRQALHALVTRHPQLRISITVKDHQPVQVVHGADHVPLEIVDGSAWQDAECVQQVARLFARPFDLAQGVCRATLITGNKHGHLLLLSIHHLATDAGSGDILLRDVRTLYAAAGRGTPAALPALAYTYADYVRWEAEMLRVEGERLRTYWHTYLAGELPVLALPTDYPRPPVQSFSGAAHGTTLDAALTRQIKNLARMRGVTLFSVLLAAYQVLLYRLSGQTDILVGSAPEAGRSRPEFSNVVGYFVNPIVLRAIIDPDVPPAFATFLHHVRQTVQEALAHQYYPFSLLVQELLPQRDASIPPLIQTLFLLYQQQSNKVADQAAGQLVPYQVDPTDGQGSGQFDLSLLIADQGDTLHVVLDYTPDLFAASTIARLAGHFETLLRGIVATPDQRIDRLPLLTDAERHQILVTWNATTVAYPQAQCVHHLIENQVARTPDAVAVVFEQHQLTYAHLNDRANQLAHYLRERGVEPDVLVGLCMERSLDMVVALLAILKAGGAYVPLDPSYPAERLAFMLQDCQAPILLTQQPIKDRLWTTVSPNGDLEAGHLLSIVCLDNDWATIAQQPAINPDSSVTATHLAYVIYTSGSTGQPKGAMIDHCAIVNRLLWMQEAYHLTATDRVLQKTPFSFDVSVWEFFWPLLAGACLVVARPEGHKDTSYLVDIIAQEQITTLHFVPPMLQVFLAEGDISRCHTLRRVICSGEALPFALQQHFYARMMDTDVELHNLYGPTEAAVDVSFWACERFPARPIVPIGRPVANTRLYILDTQLQPVPPGVAGELYIGGVQLARGYLNRPALTAEKFIPDPFSPQLEARLYKTGDLARYLPDGAIDYLGRLDHQVKVRGFRIELGEIETLLRQHPAVRETVVLLREDTPGNKRLVAYIVGTHIEPAMLRGYLSERLPDYMLPAAFVLLDTLPLTANGKIDRAALPAPDSDSLARAAYVAPRTGIEQTLAAIWQDVLGLEQVGIHDNFFALGGHSLQIMHLIARIADVTSYPVTVKDIFVYPTIATLAPQIGQQPGMSVADTVDLPDNHLDQQTRVAVELPIESRPLLGLFAIGKFGPIDAATFGSLSVPGLSPALLQALQISREEIIHEWYDNMPVFDELLETHLGNTAIITLPWFDDQLYQNQAALVASIVEGLELARQLGARVVSLAGLIPSATGYGQAIRAAIGNRTDLPAISTGHATTTAAVVLTISRMLAESGRNLSNEHVAFLGLGSIGLASLRLTLQCLPHPRMITLCDIYQRRVDLERIEQEVRCDQNYQGNIRIVESRGAVPAELYTATMIVGATNVPDILDIHRLQPGSLIVDDSAPHCFNPQLAIQRFEAQQDILFSEGGVLHLPRQIRTTRYLPRIAQRVLPEHIQHLFAWHNPYEITGCILSGLLSARFAHLHPTVGYIDLATSVQHYHLLTESGVQGAGLHCEDYILPAVLIEQFRRRFS